MSDSARASPFNASQGSPSTTVEVLRLKRKLAAVHQQLNESCHGASRKKIPTAVTMGRGIRRLISLFESLEAIINEADNRLQAEADGRVPMEPTADDEEIEVHEASERTYKAYTLLLQLVPRLDEMLQDSSIDTDTFNHFVAQLQRGANDARSDDVRRIKEEVANWINQTLSPTTPLSLKQRDDRGFQNDITGRLLCPIELSWDDDDIRRKIRTAELDISEDYFLTCFYPNGLGNSDDVEHGFLRSGLLVKESKFSSVKHLDSILTYNQTFCAIFTSPSSSEAFDEQESEEGPTRRKQKTASQKKATKTNVAALLHMDGKVTPRAIAYAATLLVFNLHDASQWIEEYNNFNFRSFYNFIIDFFESDSHGSGKRADTLLKWWNKQVFPNHFTTVAKCRKSRMKLIAQRQARA